MVARGETGGSIDGSPAIGSDGTIYIGSTDRQVYALNPDGTLKWVFPTKSYFTGSPAIGSDGTIYIGGTHLDTTLCGLVFVQFGFVYAINPDGTSKWIFRTSGAIHSSPGIGDDGTIYIGSNGDLFFDRDIPCDLDSCILQSDADPGFPANGHFYAINPDGSLKWDFRTLGYVDSSPAIGDDGSIFVGSDGQKAAYGLDCRTTVTLNPLTIGFVHSFRPDGTLTWLFDALGDVDSSPAIGSDGTIYVGSDKNDLFAINPDGTMKWAFPTRGDVNSSPTIGSDGTIYVGSNGNFDDDLYAINPDGTVKWRFDTFGSVNSSAAIGADGTIYIGSQDDQFYAIKGDNLLADTPWPKFRNNPKNLGRKE